MAPTVPARTTEGPDALGFLAAVLWVFAAAAVWLLLAPSAFGRRALERQARLLEREVFREWAYGVGLERWRDGLVGDPSAIEKEARRLGYGRPGERAYPLGTIEPATADTGLGRRGLGRSLKALVAIARRDVAPVLMLAIAGAVAVLFLVDLRVFDAAGHGPQEKPRPPA